MGRGARPLRRAVLRTRGAHRSRAYARVRQPLSGTDMKMAVRASPLVARTAPVHFAENRAN